jgi:hypothetical protein
LAGWVSPLAVIGVIAGLVLPYHAGWADGTVTGAAVHFYSTAAPPADFEGPAPQLLALAEPAAPRAVAAIDAGPEKSPTLIPVDTSANNSAGFTLSPSEPLTAPSRPASLPVKPAPAPMATHPAAEQPKLAVVNDPITLAKKAIADCKVRYHQIQDYTCRFYKRERIDGRLGAQNVMIMKARTKPMSIYFKFVKPNAGREAIYVVGRNGGKVVVHDVGIGKLIAGTLHLDPRGSRAMEDCRHPVTEAGIGNLIETVAERWAAEMRHGETQVVVQPGAKVGDRVCTMIESAHPNRSPAYMFHKVRVYIDHELGLPIRFEAYDWPRKPGGPTELLEEYTYANLKVNVGLRESEFDPSNAQYSFGRF